MADFRLVGTTATGALVPVLTAPDGTVLTTSVDDPGTPVARRDVVALVVTGEKTDLAVGTGLVSFRLPFAATLVGVRASLSSASSGADVLADVKKDGASVLSSVVRIDAGEKTTATALVPPTIAVATLPIDAEISVDVTQIGSTAKGKGLKVYLVVDVTF